MQQLQEADQVSRHLWVGNLAPTVDRATLINVAQVTEATPYSQMALVPVAPFAMQTQIRT